jgi:XTP/dITP diphosphohydrolase
MQLCFATNNAHKLDELRLLVGSKINIQSLHDIGCKADIPETGNTLQANSLQKATYIKERYALNCFADDTGLEVDFLNGAPGVLSARYAGEPVDSSKNMALLLSNLENTSDRKARFKTVITLLLEEKPPIYFEGVVEGRITKKPYGKTGFGYDPIFIPNGFSRTFAEMTANEKNGISHRGKAVRKLIEFLNKLI